MHTTEQAVIKVNFSELFQIHEAQFISFFKEYVSVFEKYFSVFLEYVSVFLKIRTWASVTGRALSATMNCTASLQSGVVKDPS